MRGFEEKKKETFKEGDKRVGTNLIRGLTGEKKFE